jgi:hypothetical protein
MSTGRSDKSTTESSVQTEINLEGELSCVLVYSSDVHVRYINALLSQLENELTSSHYKPLRLEDVIRSMENYYSGLEKIIDRCAVGVVVLDGFRPNVLFELGYLLAKRKPTVVLYSKDAPICVKSLYGTYQASGLTENIFNKKFQEPLLNVKVHLSDIGGEHITMIDWTVRPDNPLHPSLVLRNELKKREAEIRKEVENIMANQVRALSPSTFKKFVDLISEVNNYYLADASSVHVKDIKRVHKAIESMAQKYHFDVPFSAYNMIAASYVSKAKQLKGGDAEASADCINSAMQLYKQIQEKLADKESILYAQTLKKIGDVFSEFPELGSR